MSESGPNLCVQTISSRCSCTETHPVKSFVDSGNNGLDGVRSDCHPCTVASLIDCAGHSADRPRECEGFRHEPFRQLYPSRNVIIPPPWATLLSNISSPLQPWAVKSFFAPPWLIDPLVNFEPNAAKTASYLHHWISICPLCGVRLLEEMVAGPPLTVSE